MSLNSEYKDGGFSGFDRSNIKLALAFGQSNVGEGANTDFTDLTAHPADDQLLFSGSMLAGSSTAWDDLRGFAGGRVSAAIQFLRSRYAKLEDRWAGLSYSRGGYALFDDWLPGTTLEDTHLRAIMDRFGELLGYVNGHNNPIHIETLYYYQGESDSYVQANADVWKQNFYELLARFNAYGLTWDKIVVVKPHWEYDSAGMTTIRNAIDEVESERSDASSIHADIANDDGLTNHLNTLGQVIMGQAWSDLYDEQIAN